MLTLCVRCDSMRNSNSNNCRIEWKDTTRNKKQFSLSTRKFGVFQLVADRNYTSILSAFTNETENVCAHNRLTHNINA